jgi:hypothetical protein
VRRPAFLAVVALLLATLLSSCPSHTAGLRAAHAARVTAWRLARGPDRQGAAVRRAYDADRQELEAQRKRLAKRLNKGRPGAIVEARRVLDASLGDELVPAWIGTRYGFYGTSGRPRKGRIACGHFVRTVLADAGLKVPRSLGAQASARIARTFAGRDNVRWTRGKPRKSVVSRVRADGEGLYVLGLDTHVGLLRVRGRRVDFCHATGRWPRTVVCEPAGKSPSLNSHHHVVGPLLTDRVVEAWLLGQPIPLAD